MNTPMDPGKTSLPAEYAPAQPEVDTAQPTLLDQVRAQIRLRHYSIRTEAQYVQWVRRFVLFHH
jgi:hypothetical protein